MIDRLVAALDSSDGREWLELAWVVSFALGGEELTTVVPDNGDDPVPGTMGDVIRRTHTPVGRDEYFSRVRRRLEALVRAGMREDFLVRALRDEVTARVQGFARTEEANTRREELRAGLERTASDPDAIASFRAHLAETDPDATGLDDEEVTARLQDLASTMRPMATSDEQEAWNRARWWQDTVSRLISDTALATWLDKRADKVIRSST